MLKLKHLGRALRHEELLERAAWKLANTPKPSLPVTGAAQNPNGFGCKTVDKQHCPAEHSLFPSTPTAHA